MRLTHLAISNYKALKDVEIPVSRFGCLIGENNAGKSSFLQAFSLFFSGSKLAASHFFDSSKPIRIAVTIEGVNDSDLARLAEQHRGRVAAILKYGRLELVRRYDLDGKSVLLYTERTPKEPRFDSDTIANLVKSQRPGQAFVTKVLSVFPELTGTVTSTMGQEDVRQCIRTFADTFPVEATQTSDQPLPTGIDKSIEPMLPDPIYIPAVKDLTDDIKTTESTPYGKILAILLIAIEGKLPDVQTAFKELNMKLNRVVEKDGSVSDTRLAEVKLIESTVEGYVQESFANVSLRIAIPPPELKTIFSSARIFANDGIDGSIDTKGDGLRRAIVFSILRAYVSLKTKLALSTSDDDAVATTDATASANVKPAAASYLLLFEEPELFLHPKAQNILFDALRVFAKDNHVLVTTHSPTFFGPDATETFVKLRKNLNTSVAAKPFTSALHVDVCDMKAKDQFQIICFENNNAAFFADTVVLVEGDSDYLLMPHVARTLNPLWDVARTPVLFVRITGKGNIRRYRQFFRRFDIRVSVIADLDVILSGFDHVSPTVPMTEARDRLLRRVDLLIGNEGKEPTSKNAKDAHESGELKKLWGEVRSATELLVKGEGTQQQLNEAVENFYGWQRKSDRLAVLKSNQDSEMIELRDQLLGLLRVNDVYVWSKGAIEDYYPSNVSGSDKPSFALDFCAKMVTRDALLACCGELKHRANEKETSEKEFDLVFRGIFEAAVDALKPSAQPVS